MEPVIDMYEGEVIPSTPDDILLNRMLLLACRLNSISPVLIDQYIPRKYGLRNTFAFRCLMHIKAHPGLTKTGYSRLYSTCQQATCHSIDYLNSLGLVREIGKPRLIIPFQAYKIDRAYKVTLRGKKVVKDILDRAGVEY